MSDAPSPDLSCEAAGGGAAPLSPEQIERALADFRPWLEDFPAAAPPPPAPPSEVPDLDALLRLFIGLRQEVNLSTRATRSALEQNAEALRRLGGLAEEVRSGLARQAAERAPGSAEELRPVAKALLDIHDLLTLFRGRVGDMGERVSEALARLEAFLEAPLPAPPGEAPPVQAAPPRGFWSRLFGAPAPEGGSAAAERDRWLTWHEKLAEARESQADAALQAATLVRRNIESLLTGYSMSLSRLESVLARLGIEPIPCAGRPFDPEEMEVLELVPDSGQPPGNVLEEVRRGFRWNDKVLRYAQVKVAQ